MDTERIAIDNYDIAVSYDDNAFTFLLDNGDMDYEGSSELTDLDIANMDEFKAYIEHSTNRRILEIDDVFEIQLPHPSKSITLCITLYPRQPEEDNDEEDNGILPKNGYAVITDCEISMSVDIDVFIWWLCIHLPDILVKDRFTVDKAFDDIVQYKKIFPAIVDLLSEGQDLHMFPLVFEFLCDSGYRITDIKLPYLDGDSDAKRDFLTLPTPFIEKSQGSTDYVILLKFEKGKMTSYEVNTRPYKLIDTYEGEDVFILADKNEDIVIYIT